MPPKDPAAEPVRPAAGGSLLAVRVTPRARESRVEVVRGGRLEVRVKSPPEKGRANEECAELLAAALDLPRSRLQLIHGGAAREKLFLVRGLPPQEVQARLNRLQGG